MYADNTTLYFNLEDIDSVNMNDNINIHFILDTSLSWKYHTKMIAIKISKIIGILHELKYIFPKEILLIIYKSLISNCATLSPIMGNIGE